MGKTLKKPALMGDMRKPVKKSIKKAQKLKAMAAKVKNLRKKAGKLENEDQEDTNGYEQQEEQFENEEEEIQEQEMNDVEYEGEEEQPVVSMQEENVEEANEEEEKEGPVINRPSTNLVKVLKPVLENTPIYTGGRILMSPENDLFCLCNSQIVIYSLETRSVKKKIVQENEEIANFSIHPNSKSIVYFTKNYLLRNVNIEDNSLQRLWKVHNQYILDMIHDPSGRLLATGFTTGVIQVFDLKNGNTTHQFNNNKGAIVKLGFHPEPQKLILISLAEDMSLRLYDLVINSCIKTFHNFKNAPSSFTILDDGINLITSSFDLQINLYDIRDQTLQTQIGTGSEEISTVENIKLNNPKTKEAETFLLLGGQSGILKTLNLSKKQPEVIGHEYIKAEAITKIIKFKRGRKVALVTAEQNIIILGYAINSQGELEFKALNQISGYNDEVIDIKFLKRKQEAFPRELDYYAYCTNSSQIRVYYPKEKYTEFLWGHNDIVLCVDTYGNYIASGAKDNSIKLWFYDNGAFRHLCTMKGHNESVGTLSFAPVKGNYIISGSADKTLKLWAIGALKKKINAASIEDVTSAKYTIVAHDKDINCVKFAPNEKFVASASQDRTIKIFETHGLKQVMLLKGHKRGIWDIAFSPVEKVLASASGDNTIKLWNITDGTCIKTLEGHEAPVLKLDWLCYGLEIVSTSAEGLMKVWNVKKMACVTTIEKHEGKLWSLAVRVNPDTGRHEVLSGDNNSTWILWEDQTPEEEEAKKEEVNKKVLHEQQLWSLIRENKYFEAGKLSFDLNLIRSFKQSLETLLNKAEFKTFTLYTIEEDEVDGGAAANLNAEAQKEEDEFRKLVEYCIEKDLKKLFPIIRDMNTSSKFARIAQRILEIVLENVNFEDLDALRRQYNAEEGDKNLQGFLETVLAYSERHFSRVQKYVTKSFYLDYVMKHSMLISANEEEGKL